MFRSTFIDNFVFTALAALVAAISAFFISKWPFEWPFAIAELVLIIWVVRNTRTGLRRHWHRRWVEPREVAERLRVAVPMTVLGTRPLGPYGEASTWTNWYVRALLRDAGIVPGKLDTERLHVAREALGALLKTQSAYQLLTEKRLAALNRRLKWLGEVFLYLTIAAVAAHLYVELPGRFVLAFNDLGLVKNILIGLSTVLPAMGAALFGIRTIGDFDGAAKRAERMHSELADLAKTLASLPDDFHSLRAFSLLTAEVMLGDVASWRLSAESRELSAPG
jgi:hypothetical protein